MVVTGQDVSNISLLYVDDEPALLDLCKIFLERSGDISVTIAQGAPEGLRLLSEHHFDAILSDYQMPEMDGIAFLKHLREKKDATPFLIFTGKGREEVVIEALNNGADFYIQKGGDPKSQFAELINKIRYAVSRRRAEEALRESEERYRLIADNTADNIWIFDMSFKLTYVSPAVKKMRGFTVEEDLAQSLDQKMTPESCAIVMQRFQEEMALEATGTADPDRVILFETEEYCKDGSTIWVENAVRAMRDDAGRHIGVLGISRNISWRKEAERALRQSEERYRSLAEHSPIGIVTCDEDGLIDYINPTMRAMLGLASEEKAADINLLTFPPLEMIGIAEILRRTLVMGETEEPLEIECRAKDGENIRYWCHVSPFMTDDRITGGQVILTDITGRRSVEPIRQIFDCRTDLYSGIL
ncbi:hypothetical protein AZH53_00540 [Methanomicrobiaceae archaeon CYW5]|uniref:PAS domain-containing response regulator n=1 Tax=Methanovulcanius yangii TaxID=1789227 RepID=UPI0029CA71F2|nr:PAS domain S-box protein [Methanovulcanius yangii]MBT8506917.1 hypothetical protein [Methanovulcanius yangii]